MSSASLPANMRSSFSFWTISAKSSPALARLSLSVDLGDGLLLAAGLGDVDLEQAELDALGGGELVGQVLVVVLADVGGGDLDAGDDLLLVVDADQLVAGLLLGHLVEVHAELVAGAALASSTEPPARVICCIRHWTVSRSARRLSSGSRLRWAAA